VKTRPCVEKTLRGDQADDPDADPDDDQGRVYLKERRGDPKVKGPVCGSRELISWRLTQKYFFDETFGGAVIKGRRNIFDTTLALSGIAFLTEPRAVSPVISRLRVRTSEHLDVEWDFDLDTGAKKFTSNNVMLDLHEGNVFGGLSYARLNAPGRFYTEGVASTVSNFNQLRLLLGYGSPTKAGLGIAANVGLDLNAGDSGLVQYGALQGSYNWDCCGFSVEVRKYELGSVRNETVERFNFTLSNIGTAGNLRRAASLF
jgi:LPS-assembly protein